MPDETSAELRRRAVEGVRAEVAVFGNGAPDSRAVHRDGLLAAITPATPDRSIFNSVYYEDPAVLAGALDELGASYDRAGVRAWAVWVPDEDRDTAELLAARGHTLDASPRAMALWLSELAPAPPAPEGVSEAGADQRTAALLNDRAYGYEGDAFGAALAQPTEPPVRWSFAARDGEPVACVGTIEVGDDCCVTGVATHPEHQRKGTAGWLLHRVLEDARARGLRSASLQAAKAGAGVYARLGFRDLGFVEIWERRVPAP